MQHLSRKYYERILPRMAAFNTFWLDCRLAEPNRPGITIANKTSLGVVRVRGGNKNESFMEVDAGNQILCAAVGSQTQIYFLYQDTKKRTRLGFYDLKPLHESSPVSLTVCDEKRFKGEVSQFAMGTLRSQKRYIFIVLGRRSLLLPCELHVFDLVDQYWEKLENIPFLSTPMPFPMVSASEGRDSHLYVTNNDWKSLQAKAPVSFSNLLLWRKQISEFLYSPWEKIELSYETNPTFCMAVSSTTGIIVFGKRNDYRNETTEIYFDPKELNSLTKKTSRQFAFSESPRLLFAPVMSPDNTPITLAKALEGG